MDFIQTPILVGDPDGRAVYVNPAFESDFLQAAEDVVGRPLANLFEGGGREAVLHAVAQVCDASGRDSARFGLLVRERGYRALASAVEAEGGRVGVILLLVREIPREGRVQAFRREILAPLEELGECLATIASHAEGPGVHTQRLAVADGIRCLERMKKWAHEVAATLNEK